MMHTPARVTAAIVTLAVSASAAAAQSTVFAALLTGSQEVPPAVTLAIGFSTLTYNVNTNAFLISGNFAGLTTPAMMAHIHVAPPGVGGPILFDLTDVLTMATSGVIAPKSGVFTDQQEAELFAGNLYVNIHTPTYPTGEIRGQLLYQSGPRLDVVPEPGTVLLLGSGLAAIGAVRWRRRRA